MTDKSVAITPFSQYAIRLVEKNGEVELSIRELLITARARDIATAMKLLVERWRLLVAHAATTGVLDELPAPRPAPPIDTGHRSNKL